MNDQDVALKARAFIAAVSPSVLPVPVEAYAARIGGTVSSDPLGDQEDAWSVQLPDGTYRICVNCGQDHRRQRFSICHEVAHVVLGIPAEHEAPSWSYARRSPGEVACDVFASELLLPYKMLKPLVDSVDPGMNAISELADKFDASLVATASRFATFSREYCAFVLSEAGRVRFCARSTSLRAAGAWVSPGAMLPSDSLSARLRRGDTESGPVDAEPEQWFDDWNRNGFLYEDSRHIEQWDQTLTLLWFEDEELPPPPAERERWDSERTGLRELDGILPWPDKAKRRR